MGYLKSWLVLMRIGGTPFPSNSTTNFSHRFCQLIFPTSCRKTSLGEINTNVAMSIKGQQGALDVHVSRSCLSSTYS